MNSFNYAIVWIEMINTKIFIKSLPLTALFFSLSVFTTNPDPYIQVSTGVAELGKNWNTEVNVKTTDLFIELHLSLIHISEPTRPY